MRTWYAWREVLGEAWLVLWEEARAWAYILSGGRLCARWFKRRYR